MARRQPTPVCRDWDLKPASRDCGNWHLSDFLLLRILSCQSHIFIDILYIVVRKSFIVHENEYICIIQLKPDRILIVVLFTFVERINIVLPAKESSGR